MVFWLDMVMVLLRAYDVVSLECLVLMLSEQVLDFVMVWKMAGGS